MLWYLTDHEKLLDCVVNVYISSLTHNSLYLRYTHILVTSVGSSKTLSSCWGVHQGEEELHQRQGGGGGPMGPTMDFFIFISPPPQYIC